MRLHPLSSLLAAGLGASAALVGANWEAPQAQRPLAVGGQPGAEPAAAPPASSSAPEYRDDLLALHKSLIEIPSLSGAEGDVGDWLIGYLTNRRYRAVKQVMPPRANASSDRERFNVIAWPVGGGDADAAADDDAESDGLWHHPRSLPRLLVTSHIDVVPPHIPYHIDTDGGAANISTIISGRGSVDAKGSVAAQITAVEALRRAGVVASDGKDALLLFVVGEEDSGDGMRVFSESLGARFPATAGFEAAIFGEPTENKLACGHKGILGCTVTAAGKAGHSGYPWLGKSANEVLVRGLVAALDADLGSSEVFGNTTVNVGLLAGGVAGNVIPAEAQARVAIRVATGPQATGHELVRGRLAAALASVDAEALSLDCVQGYGVVECNCAVDGFDTITVNYGTDVPSLAGNHTRYLYGPGDILVAHSDHEALAVGDLEAAVEGYKKLIRHALGK